LRKWTHSGASLLKHVPHSLRRQPESTRHAQRCERRYQGDQAEQEYDSREALRIDRSQDVAGRIALQTGELAFHDDEAQRGHHCGRQQRQRSTRQREPSR
jgi:hypothetical protein